MNKFKKTPVAIMAAAALFSAQHVSAKTVEITMTAVEAEMAVDNKGAVKMEAWTFDGTIPGKPVRVNQGDTVDFTLINPASNTRAHAMDFHAAEVDVLKEFGEVQPGEKKHFKFVANVPGVFMYHCGAGPMVQHIAKGMYGMIIVEPKDKKNYPKADREYVLVQQQFFPDTMDTMAMLENKGWEGSLINGKMFRYDPVHDADSKQVLEAKPGERVRIYFLNANINNPVALHPIAGMWDRVYVGPAARARAGGRRARR